MNTPPGTRLRIADLARRSVFKHSIPAGSLTRLAAVAEVRESIHAEFAFRIDAQNRHWLSGKASGTVAQECHRCLEPVTRSISSEFDLWLVTERELPHLQKLQNLDREQLLSADLHVLIDDVVDLHTLIEDELLLTLDSQPCQDAACPSMPVMTYGAESEVQTSDEQSQHAAETHRPFAELKQRLQQKKNRD
ncbi:MAG: YceD family protein [Pseudomonadales bacterium]